MMYNALFLKGRQRVCRFQFLLPSSCILWLSRTKEGSLSPEFPQLVALASNSKTKKGQSLLVLLWLPEGCSFWHTKDRAFQASGVEVQTGDRHPRGTRGLVHVRSDTNLQAKMQCHLLNALPSLVGSFHLLHETCLIFFLSCPWGESLIFMVSLDGPWLLGFGWRLYIL